MIIILLIALLFPATISAQTPIATTSASPNTSQEIQKIRQAVQQKVLEKLKEITTDSNPDQIKSYFGTVISLENNQAVLEYLGQNYQITIDPEAVYIDLKRNKSATTNIKTGQGLLAMGKIDSSKNLNALRLVAIEIDSIKPQAQIVFGQISDISQSSPVFTLIPFTNKNQQFQIKTTTTTQYFNSKKQKITLKDISKGHRLIAVIKESTNSTYSAVTLISLDHPSTVTPSPTPKP